MIIPRSDLRAEKIYTILGMRYPASSEIYDDIVLRSGDLDALASSLREAIAGPISVEY